MPGPIGATGAQQAPSRYGALGMDARQFTGLWTQRSPFRDAGVQYLISKFYSGSRFDSILDGINREISTSLTDKRSPGSIVYNSQTFPALRSFYSWDFVQNGAQKFRIMADADANVFDATGPSTKLNLWNKSTKSGRTRFLGVNTELFFNDGVEPKKVLESALTWQPNTLYDGEQTSDTPLGDFIIDPNGNVQQAVGGFVLLISAVQILNNVLTLTLNTSQLTDPSGQPSGVAQTTGGNLSPAQHFVRIAGVDANGNVTEAGTESAAVITTGATSQIVWTWPAISGAVSYRIYVGTASGAEASYFTSSTNSFTQTADTSNVAGTPPTVNVTSVNVPSNLFQMVGVQLALSGITAANFLNGQNISIQSILPGNTSSTQITAQFAHADYPQTNDTGQASSGSGITGGVEPGWSQQLAGVTQDGGAQWINRSSAVQNWGIATPGSAPTVFPSPVPPSTTYPKWAADTFYWPSRCAYVDISGTRYIFLLTQSGTTGPAPPSWNISVIGAMTADNSAVWTFEGPATWQPNTVTAKGAYTTFQPPTGGLQVYIATNPGTTGANQDGWMGGVNTTVIDNDILWQCLGTIVPYESTGTPQTFPLTQWPNIGSISFRTSFALTPAQPNVLLFALANLENILPGGAVTISGCANPAMDGSGTVLQAGIALPFTSGYGVAVSMPYTGGTYHPYTDQAGGTMVYTGQGQGLTPLINVSAAAVIVDSNGFLEQIQDPGGFSGLSQPTWAAQGGTTQEILTADITAYTITSGVATIEADNNFGDLPGEDVTIDGMSASFLNGTWPLLAATDTTFQIQTAHADVAHTSDQGTATIPGGALWLNIGPFAPKSTAVSRYAYSFANSVTGHVGTASAASVPIMLQADFQATIQGFGSADPQVDTIWLWATPQGTADLVFMDKIANPGGGVPWTYTRTMPDVSTTGGPELNPFILAPTAQSNNPPPVNITAPVYHLNRIWGIVNNTVVHSGGPDTLVGSGNEAFDPNDVIPYVAQPIRLIPVTVENGGILVMTTDGMYIILGTGTANNPFYTTNYFSSVSISGYDAVAIYNNSVFAMETNGRVSSIAVQYPFNPQSGYEEVGFPIGDQFLEVQTGGPLNTVRNSTFADDFDFWTTTPRGGDTLVASGDAAIYTVNNSPLSFWNMFFQEIPASFWRPGQFLCLSAYVEDTCVNPANPNLGNFNIVLGFYDPNHTFISGIEQGVPLNGVNPSFQRATITAQIPENAGFVRVSVQPALGNSTVQVGSTITVKEFLLERSSVVIESPSDWTDALPPVYDPATTYLSWNLASTKDSGLYVADGSIGWFRMNFVSPPESGILWSPRRAIAGGTSCVQDVEVNTGVHRLLMGPAESGPILLRDATFSVFTDNGVTYPAWDDKGLNKLCSTGEWAEVSHIAAKSSAVGARPSVSVLLDEITSSAQRPWKRLKLEGKTQDPPLNRKSKTYYSDRYVLSQGGEGMTGDYILTRFDYGDQAQPDELQDWQVYASVHQERAESTVQPR